ncbi:TRM-domain-containing protein [Venturia nashicola]|uniref:tRNA (guanine(26)-N(2))-dimethyltransferase n=1 Tax=Venturia nashicola TaxID=86259 RepID=A0A4Z1PCZ0_9PEZI|nr:TRM-domain-containing protein [Venturia nashicola]
MDNSVPAHSQEPHNSGNSAIISPASISDPPSANQRILHDGKVYTTIKEGLAYVLIPPDAPLSQDPSLSKGEGPAQSVFYNPIQQYNRDLTVLAIRAFGEAFVAEKLAKAAELRDRRRKKAANKLNKRKGKGQETEAQGERNKRKLRETEIEGAAEQPPAKKSKANRNSTSDLLDDDIPDEDLLACEATLPTQPSQPPQPSHPSQPVDAIPRDTVKEQEPLEEWRPPFQILDALSATGLRALRYAQELPFVTSVTANDLSPKAVEMIAVNIKHNKLEDKIKTSTGNAMAHMYSLVGQEGKGGPGPKYEVIDIDPYGTAVPFLDAAIQALSNGGLLCVTCTDSGVFNSIGYSEKTFSLYGGLPIKGEHCHEAGLRLILHAINSSAAKYGISVEPLLSLSIDYYARVFVRVRRSPAEVKFHSSKTMMVYSCDHGCGAWETQFLGRAVAQTSKNGQVSYKHGSAQGPITSPLCEHCGSKMHIAGPMYGGPLHNPSFVDKMLELLPSLDKSTYKTLDRIEGMLQTAYDEMHMFDSGELLTKVQGSEKRVEASYLHVKEAAIDHHPFYVVPSALSRIIHCQAPSDAQLRGALRGLGYKALKSHAKPGTIKTDAPWTAIWEIMREWVRQKCPLKEGTLKEGMPGFKIMAKATEVGFEFGGYSAESHGGWYSVAEELLMLDSQKERNRDESASEADKKEAQGIVFDEELGADKQTKRLVRYQMNPRANWGPMSRAK